MPYLVRVSAACGGVNDARIIGIIVNDPVGVGRISVPVTKMSRELKMGVKCNLPAKTCRTERLVREVRVYITKTFTQNVSFSSRNL